MAAAQFTFELAIRGTGILPQKFMEADARLVRGLQRVVRKYGDDTRRLAKSLCPVDTGYMKAMLKTQYSEDGFTFEVGWNLGDDFLGTGRNPYPFYQEFGTRNHSAQPSINPAFREMAPKFQAACGGYVATWAASEIRP
jgi:HK97 gp10 family phage protein